MADTRMASPSPCPTPPQFSRPQTATYDVLLIVFKHLASLDCPYIEGELVAFGATCGAPTMRGLSLVCRNWRDAGQAALWKGIVFSERKQCKLFLQSAKERPDLAKQVRAVSVGRLVKHPAQTNDPADDKDWLGLSKLMLECLNLCHRGPFLSLSVLFAAKTLTSSILFFPLSSRSPLNSL
jgi:hypothetical protein